MAGVVGLAELAAITNRARIILAGMAAPEVQAGWAE
jgi:hypothetical protein